MNLRGMILGLIANAFVLTPALEDVDYVRVAKTLASNINNLREVYLAKNSLVNSQSETAFRVCADGAQGGIEIILKNMMRAEAAVEDISDSNDDKRASFLAGIFLSFIPDTQNFYQKIAEEVVVDVSGCGSRKLDDYAAKAADAIKASSDLLGKIGDRMREEGVKPLLK